MALLPLRVYATGRVAVECGDARLDQAALPGRQGRAAFVYLTLNRTRPVPRDELVAALWPADAPPSVDAALSAVVSKLRGALNSLGVEAASALTSSNRCYELRLPPGSTVDVETAANRLDRAEGAVRSNDIGAAWSDATVATAILRRPLLPADDAPWLAAKRVELQALLVRAYDVLVEVWLARGDTTLAVVMAREGLALAPFRETGYRRLMRAHAAAGDRAEALRTYEECRTLLREELGVNPSAETQAAYRSLLG